MHASPHGPDNRKKTEKLLVGCARQRDNGKLGVGSMRITACFLATITARTEKAEGQGQRKEGEMKRKKGERIDVIATDGDLLTGGGLILQMPDFSAIDRSYFCDVAKGVVKLLDARFEDRRLWRYNELEV